jgi:hypothetical protein
MGKLNGIEVKDLKYKDIVIYLFVTEYPFRTLKELSFITGSNYSRLSESLKTLIEKQVILKTETYPAKYIKNDN